MSDPETGGSQSESGEEVSCELIEVGGDPAEVLQLVEEPLDEVALAVDLGIDRATDADVALAWNMSGAAAGLDELDDAAGEVAAVGDDVAAQIQALEQHWRGRLVGDLAPG